MFTSAVPKVESVIPEVVYTQKGICPECGSPIYGPERASPQFIISVRTCNIKCLYYEATRDRES